MSCYILSIETTTSVCGVALLEGDRPISECHLNIQNSHAEKLTILIDNLLSTAGITATDLAAIAVSKGPGSYTGLRIGVSTAKGLCFALGIPLISVETLQAMALQANQSNIAQALLCPMIDARRMEVYCALFDANLKQVLPTQAKILDEHSFLEHLQQHPILFFGDGANKWVDICQHHNAFWIDKFLPSARQIGLLAYQAHLQKRYEDTIYFEPYYLKDFVSTQPKSKKTNHGNHQQSSQ